MTRCLIADPLTAAITDCPGTVTKKIAAAYSHLKVPDLGRQQCTDLHALTEVATWHERCRDKRTCIQLSGSADSHMHNEQSFSHYTTQTGTVPLHPETGWGTRLQCCFSRAVKWAIACVSLLIADNVSTGKVARTLLVVFLVWAQVKKKVPCSVGRASKPSISPKQSRQTKVKTYGSWYA